MRRMNLTYHGCFKTHPSGRAVSHSPAKLTASKRDRGMHVDGEGGDDGDNFCITFVDLISTVALEHLSIQMPE